MLLLLCIESSILPSAGVNHLIDVACQALLHVESTGNTDKDDSFMPEICAASTYHHSEGNWSVTLRVLWGRGRCCHGPLLGV